MNVHGTTISEEIRRQVRSRAVQLATEKDAAQAIFNTLADHGIDFSSVSLEQYKSMLVDAVRAQKLSRREALAVHEHPHMCCGGKC